VWRKWWRPWSVQCWTTLAVFVPLYFWADLRCLVFLTKVGSCGAADTFWFPWRWLLFPGFRLLLFISFFSQRTKSGWWKRGAFFPKFWIFYELAIAKITCKSEGLPFQILRFLFPLGLLISQVLKTEDFRKWWSRCHAEVDWMSRFSSFGESGSEVHPTDCNGLKWYSQAEARCGQCDSFCFWLGKFHSSNSLLYFLFTMWKQKEVAIRKKLEKLCKAKLYPQAAIYLGRRFQNAFDQLFNASMPYYEVNERIWLPGAGGSEEKMASLLTSIPLRRRERGSRVAKRKASSRIYSRAASIGYLSDPVNAIQEQAFEALW